MTRRELAASPRIPRNHSRNVAMPQVEVWAAIADGPLNSNAALATLGSIVSPRNARSSRVLLQAHPCCPSLSPQATSDLDGIAIFNGLTFTAGIPGIYVVTFRAMGPTCNAVLHSLRVNLTNPVGRVVLSLAGVPVTAATTSSFAPRVLTIGEPAPKLTVCTSDLRGNGTAFQGTPVILRTVKNAMSYADPQAGGIPAPMIWSDWDEATVAASDLQANIGAKRGTAVDWCASQPQDDRSPVPVSGALPPWTTDASGCVALQPLRLTKSTGTKGWVMLEASVHGVDSAPLYVTILTPAEAHPASLNDLRARIPLPLALVLGPFAANAVHYRYGGALHWLVLGGSIISVRERSKGGARVRGHEQSPPPPPRRSCSCGSSAGCSF